MKKLLALVGLGALLGTTAFFQKPREEATSEQVRIEADDEAERGYSSNFTDEELKEWSYERRHAEVRRVLNAYFADAELEKALIDRLEISREPISDYSHRNGFSWRSDYFLSPSSFWYFSSDLVCPGGGGVERTYFNEGNGFLAYGTRIIIPESFDLASFEVPEIFKPLTSEEMRVFNPHGHGYAKVDRCPTGERYITVSREGVPSEGKRAAIQQVDDVVAKIKNSLSQEE